MKTGRTGDKERGRNGLHREIQVRDRNPVSPDKVPEAEDGGLNDFLFTKVPKTFTFWKWCAGLLRNVLRTRTPFSAFLKSSLHVPRDDSVSTSSLFPVPVPETGLFNRMPACLSLHARRRLHLKRVLHIAAMALNYWHGGLGSFPNERLLSRCPSSTHRSIYKKLMGIIAADGPDSGVFETLACGRKFPQLVARLGELSESLTKLGAWSPRALQPHVWWS